MTQNQSAAKDDDIDGPADLGLRGWWQIGKQTMAEAGDDNLGLIAAGIAFNAFLALIPLLTAVVLGYGLVASPEQVAEHIAVLTRTLPQEAAGIIGDQLESMVDSAGTATGFGLIIALGVALFGTLRGATGVILGLNIAYGVPERRTFVRHMLAAVSITLGAVAVFLFASIGISVVNLLADLAPDLGGAVRTALRVGFWLAAAAGVSLVLALIYAFAPNREERDWRWLTPGSVLATLVWIGATLGFSFYVGNFGNYNATYGALGAVIVFLTWLYLSAYIVLLGAELNQVLEHRARANSPRR